MIYYIHSNYYDGCNQWESNFLHCKNKQFLLDLCKKLEKVYTQKAGYDFSVCEFTFIRDTPTKQQVNTVLEYMGFTLNRK